MIRSKIIAEYRAIGLAEKMTGELLSQNQEMAELLHIKSRFISTVSHELRTPLTSIKEGINIVLDGSAGEINEEQKKFLELAGRNLDRLHRLINDVLDFSKLEAKKMQFNKQPNDLNKLIAETVKTHESVAKKKGLYIKTELDTNLPNIPFDADKIIQVISNLLNNSIKFTNDGGITITTKLDAYKKLAVFHIADTGRGIKKSEIKKLFREFQQLENDSYHKPGGSGLGLAISKQIIEGHNGQLGVESEYGTGSDFMFTLPMEDNK
jgi:hypothetical protein